MATTSKQMYNGAATTTTTTTLYTAPATAGAVAVVTNVLIANTDSSSHTFTLGLGGTSIATAETIAANSTAFFDLKQVLNASQTITGGASSTTVNILISGVEIV